MEFLIELVVQVVVEVVFEFLVWLVRALFGALFGGRRSSTHWPASARRRANVALVSLVLSLTIAVIGGLRWGRHVASIGHRGTPMSVYVAAGLACGAAVLAAWRLRDRERLPSMWDPRRWPWDRWAVFAVANAVAALSIWRGFDAWTAPLR